MKIPATIDNFVGRQKEINQILDFLKPNKRHWIISIQGIGGIGKTELAIYVANYVKNNKIYDKIAYVTAKNSWLELDGIKSKPLSLTLNELLNDIIYDTNLSNELMKKSTNSKLEKIMDVLANEKVLLIIDNLETITDEKIFQFLNDIL